MNPTLWISIMAVIVVALILYAPRYRSSASRKKIARGNITIAKKVLIHLTEKFQGRLPTNPELYYYLLDNEYWACNPFTKNWQPMQVFVAESSGSGNSGRTVIKLELSQATIMVLDLSGYFVFMQETWELQ